MKKKIKVCHPTKRFPLDSATLSYTFSFLSFREQHRTIRKISTFWHTLSLQKASLPLYVSVVVPTVTSHKLAMLHSLHKTPFINGLSLEWTGATENRDPNNNNNNNNNNNSDGERDLRRERYDNEDRDAKRLWETSDLTNVVFASQHFPRLRELKIGISMFHGEDDLVPLGSFKDTLEKLHLRLSLERHYNGNLESPSCLHSVRLLKELRHFTLEVEWPDRGGGEEYQWKVGTMLQSLVHLHTLCLSHCDPILVLEEDAALLPMSLTSLDTSLSSFNGYYIIEPENNRATEWITLFTRLPLRTLGVNIDLDDANLYMLLKGCPALETLHCNSITLLGSGGDGGGNSTLTRLRVAHQMSTATVRRLFDLFRGLKELRWKVPKDASFLTIYTVTAPALHSLFIVWNRRDSNDTELDLFCRWSLPNLCRLSIEGGDADVSFKSLQPISAFSSSLTSLEWTNVRLEKTVEMPRLPNLETLAVLLSCLGKDYPCLDHLFLLYPRLLQLTCQSGVDSKIPMWESRVHSAHCRRVSTDQPFIVVKYKE